MRTFLQNLPHLLMATILIAAATTLALHGTINGPEALAVIGTASGFSLGAGSVSASTSAVAQTRAGDSTSPSNGVTSAPTTTTATTTTTTPEA